MSQSMLFPEPVSAPSKGAGSKGPFARVALEQSLDQILDYSVPAGLITTLRAGQRVRVPLGRKNKPVLGYVVEVRPTCDWPTVKPIIEIDDERVLVTPALMELSLWMSRYYCAPLGTVLESVIPAAVKKRVGLGYVHVVRLAQERTAVQALVEKTRARKRRAALARLLQVEEGEGIDLAELAREAGTTAATIRKLAKAGVVSIATEPDFDSVGAGSTFVQAAPQLADVTAPELNEDQQKAFDDLRPRVSAGAGAGAGAGGFSVNLLYGVTGSGKTELYLRCIAEVVAAGRQAIVMVPEIALTPQTVRRFTARFPRIAVLHSGLTASQRHHYWQQIWRGGADVVVGARSAVFAPLPKLGMIVVDEEHESSYKQDSAPRYHGRDLAIKRAQLEGVPVLLGSATPSLETWQRVQNAAVAANGAEPEAARAQYHLQVLPNRVRGLAMPKVELVDMKVQGRMRQGIHLLSARLEHLLKQTVAEGRQAILLLNRRGYANFIYCPSCANVMQCKYCDVTLTYHRSAGAQAAGSTTSEGVHTGQLHCHYCLAVNPLPERCEACGKKLSLFGLGTQRVEEEIKRKFPDLKFARVDSDTMRHARDYEALLERFGRGEIQLMLGTQMIAKGLDYPNVTLVGVISGDTALSLPDFRAAERTFQLITQVAGRAGRGEAPGRVVLQTFLPNDPTIRYALGHDYEGFARTELEQRRQVGLPPFGRMVRIVMRDAELDKLHVREQDLAVPLSAASAAEGGAVTLRGPMPCAINRIAGFHRSQFLLTSPSAARLQRVLKAVRDKKGFASSDRIAVDVDPISLL